ncbi:MAG: hypothetical protein R3B45_04125 [Bdellovibrionota bacterium]
MLNHKIKNLISLERSILSSFNSLFKNQKIFLYFCSLYLHTLIVNCAGPSSPFGAINRFKKPQQEAEYLQENKKITFLSDNEFDPATTEEKNTSSIPDILEEANISFYPDRQILHAPSKLKVIINTDVKINRQMDLKIFYNGDDMTSTILANSRMEILPRRIKSSCIWIDSNFLLISHTTFKFLFSSKQNISEYRKKTKST